MGISTEALISIIGILFTVPPAIILLPRLSHLFRSLSPDKDTRVQDDIEIGVQRPPPVHFRPQLLSAVTWPQQLDQHHVRANSNALQLRHTMDNYNSTDVQRHGPTRPGTSVFHLSISAWQLTQQKHRVCNRHLIIENTRPSA
ncbi:hypothetical protein Forpi1262_v014471 [Fusarium oxysporum f. sp. raphani]|uniref:Uncharacterized protein n=1 Tax=Fusarium oxysporum f. sp. raphani TaxID=96318 RepID=A0A8J5PSN7_FUSOX|nr:hypothetical protein Forpi1262_v014471 [Fusarium oxysporum f. sp. raphani]